MLGISEIVGRTYGAGRGRKLVYRALRDLVCSSCGKTIRVGELFTRHKLHGQAVSLMPKCRECLPFEAPHTEQQTNAPSELIESLLAPSATVGKDSTSTKERASEEMTRRLEPALLLAERRRRKRGSSE